MRESPRCRLRALIAFALTAVPGSRPVPEHHPGSDQPGHTEWSAWSALLRRNRPLSTAGAFSGHQRSRRHRRPKVWVDGVFRMTCITNAFKLFTPA